MMANGEVLDQDTTKQELQNTTASGTAPRRRLASPEAAYAIYKKYNEIDEPAAMGRAVIQGMIDGNPPYDPEELKEQGLADMVNVNFLSMRANLDSRAASAHELFVEVPTLVEFKPLSGAPASPEEYHYCSVMGEEFTQLMHDWPQFLPTMDLVVRESDAYGIGFVLWPDEFDWRPRAFRRGNLRFDPKASVEVDRNDIYMCRDEYTAGELYDIVEDAELAAKRGWKPGNVRDLLVRVFITGEQSDEDKYQKSTWESLQQMSRNHDPTFQEKQFEKVRVVHIFVREVAAPRRISHFIIAEADSKEVFLCEALDRFADMHEVIWWLPYNYGDGYASSVRGVASQMVQHDDLSNRFLGRVFDAGFMASSLLLQPQTQGDLGRLQFFHHGPYTVLPPELKAVQSTFQPQLSPLLQLRQVSENIMLNKTGLYKQHNESIENETQKTARQVIEEVSKEARYEKAAVAHRYNHLDWFYREVMRRLTRPEYINGEAEYPGKEEAKRFVKRCEDRGVPKAFITGWADKCRLDSTRALGLGSLGVKYDITNQLMGARGDMDELGRRNVLRDWLAVRVGYRNVDKYAAAVNRDQIPTNEQSIATLENSDMLEGTAALVGVDQLHKLHIDTHLPIIIQIIQAEQAAQIRDPQGAATTLQLEAQHVGQHLQLLARDPTRVAFVKQVQEVLQLADQTLRRMASMIKRQQQAQAKEQQAQQEKIAQADQVLRDRDFELKVMEINRKYAAKEMEQRSLNEMRAAKTEEQVGITRQRAEHDMELAASRQAEELRQKALTAEAERQLAAQRG